MTNQDTTAAAATETEVMIGRQDKTGQDRTRQVNMCIYLGLSIAFVPHPLHVGGVSRHRVWVHVPAVPVGRHRVAAAAAAFLGTTVAVHVVNGPRHTLLLRAAAAAVTTATTVICDVAA